MSININDIAKMANVSKATVSLALNGSKLVKDETRNKIEKLAKEHGYSPNAMAQGLAKRKSGTIGLIVPDIESAYYGKLVRCIDENVREAGYNLIIAISNDKPETEKKIIRSFISERVEGVIMSPVNGVNLETGYVKILDKQSIPYLFVTSHYPMLDSSYVMVDLEGGSYNLVKYLLDIGHRNIFFIGGSRQVITTDYRINGYMKAFDERGLNVEQQNLITCTRLNYEQAYKVTERLIKDNKHIDAIITINDIMALAALNAIRANGLRVPEDISVAGYDDMIFSTISPVPITTVKQDIEHMSRNVVDIMIKRIKSGSVENEKVLIKPELIIRESTSSKV